MSRHLKSQKGVGMVEALITVGISIIFIVASQRVVVDFIRSRTQLSRSIMTRVLMTQVVSDLAGSWKKYPLTFVGNQAGTYVLCYDQSLALVPFSLTETSRILPMGSL